MNRRTMLSNMMVLPWVMGASRAGAWQAHDHSAMVAGDGEFNPFVISDDRGGFYMTAVRRMGGQSDVYFQRSSGGRFTEPIRVNDRPGDAAVRNENPPKIAAGPGNEIYVVWANERERWKGNIRFARSLNGGRSFESAIDLNSDGAKPPVSRAFQTILVDSRGRVLVAWIDERGRREQDRGAEIWMAISGDRGKTFSRDRKILANVCECCRIALAADAAGTIYLSYRTVRASGPMYRDIAVARSTDGAETFHSTLVHQDRWELSGCPIAGPTMAIDDAGGVHVVWFSQPGDAPRLRIASSKDRGKTFGAPFIFDTKQKVAKHAHAVAAPGNRVLIAWDNVDGESSVRWGLFDPSSRTTRILGEHAQASYPVIAATAQEIAVTALRPEHPEAFRIIQRTNF